VDPRHRLLSSKYNPARTFTAEGTVGIGGMYMCIYGMDSPGGYQLVGRTLPIWNKYLRNSQFDSGQPWLLRFFDQVCFYPVEEAELAEQREAFRVGRHRIAIDEEVFDYEAHRSFLTQHAKSITAFRDRQQACFAAEIAHWADHEAAAVGSTAMVAAPETQSIPEGYPIHAPMHGSIWKILARPGDTVKANQVVVIVEAMKVELAVVAPREGIITTICCTIGQPIVPGEILAAIVDA
jgi:urea carboxylase